jgi:hypothetical protein
LSLGFFTQNHHMTFANAFTGQSENAGTLHPNTIYHVSLIIKNDSNHAEPSDPQKPGIEVFVQHTPYGIGLPGTTTNIIQPTPVYVPPHGPDGDGLATVSFYYTTPVGGHSCLTAKIMPNGSTLSQNTNVSNTPIGVPSTHSFLVFGGTGPETMSLTVTESSEPNVPPYQTWNPKIIAPPGIGLNGPETAPVNLNLPANSFYSIGLQVTPPIPCDNKIHNYLIVGTVGNKNVGSVNISIKPVPQNSFKPCDPYILGTYQSADVILVDPDTGLPVPLGIGGTATSLKPGKKYGFAACVHNASVVPAVNTVVRFWQFGTLNSVGPLIDVQTVTIPPNSDIIVQSAKPFPSAPLGQHKCAVVSIYNSVGGSCPDAVVSGQVPTPWPADHACAAWRNTDSIFINLGKPWELNLELALPAPIPYPLTNSVPVDVMIHTHFVPPEWKKTAKVDDLVSKIAKAGIPCKVPLHMIPSLRETMKSIDLRLDVKTEHSFKVEKFELPTEVKKLMAKPRENLQKAFRFNLKEKPVPFTISGIIPDTTNPGDIILVDVVAHYSATETLPARDIEFLQVFHVEKQ